MYTNWFIHGNVELVNNQCLLYLSVVILDSKALFICACAARPKSSEFHLQYALEIFGGNYALLHTFNRCANSRSIGGGAVFTAVKRKNKVASSFQSLEV